jgi:hypothetical protein
MIHLCNENDDPRWDDYVLRNTAGHAYQLSAWHRIIASSFGHRTYRLIAEDGNGAVVGVLPVARLQSRLFGDFMVSMPYVNYGGPCADDDAIKGALIDEAVALARDNRVQHLEIRTVATEPTHGLQSRSAKVSMHLDLPATPDELWKRFTSKLRSQIKRAQQEELTVTFGREELLAGFMRCSRRTCATSARPSTPINSSGRFFASCRSPR